MANPNELLAQLGAQQRQLAAAVEQMTIERTREMERLRGIKMMRFGPYEQTGANPFLALADTTGLGPDQGYVWSLKLLVIEGLTRGTTPDVVQITRGSLRVIWELNGNVYAQSWGKGDQWLNGGENLGFNSVGTFAAAGKIIIHGQAWQVPAEEAGKIL